MPRPQWTTELGTLDDATPARAAAAESFSPELPKSIADRYQVQAPLGHGGMASVYRVVDLTTGSTLALKLLTLRPGDRSAERRALFEREFYLLSQLAHPSMIAVYDYGVDPRGPYYTMELLDGEDLQQLSPLAWQKACALAYDVCSSLALLHSRRFIHRDISPRNVRCGVNQTAKLIDFGAVVPMGVCSQLVGTPAFVPPESLHGGMLDARADLYSLGATLYFALTTELPYQAYSFADLARAWTAKPYAPSLLVPDVPLALDELVMSLISPDPALRPRNAFEVMQRLSAIAGLSPSESVAVPNAYLTAPVVVGREREQEVLRTQVQGAIAGRGSAVCITGPSGIGSSRMLDVCAIEAKTLGACVARTRGLGTRAFATAMQLITQLADAAPETASPLLSALGLDPRARRSEPAARESALTSEPDTDDESKRQKLVELVCKLSEHVPIALLVDDVQEADEASLIWLVALAQVCPVQRLTLVVAMDHASLADAERALAALVGVSKRLSLTALDKTQTGLLIASLFGDVPNLPLLTECLHDVAQGNPGQTLSLAQWLVDRGIISYAGGTWSLPEQLRAADLPAGHDPTLENRLSQLTPLARKLLTAHALAVTDTLKRADFAQLARESDAAALDRALQELLLAQLLIVEGELFRLASTSLRAAMPAMLDTPELSACHADLARMYESQNRSSLLAVGHLLHSGQPEAALEQLQRYTAEYEQRVESGNEQVPILPFRTMVAVCSACLTLAEQTPSYNPRALGECRRQLVLLSITADDASYFRAAPAWREQLREDSGLARWQSRSDLTDPAKRLTDALELVTARYNAMPIETRGYRADEAIQRLVQYVVLSIAVGGRSLLWPLVSSLPPLLEPFAPLSPVLEAIWQNATAVCENQAGQLLAARTRWQGVLERLAPLSGNDLRYVDAIRNAIAFGIGTIEASLGMTSTERWASMLDADPMQHVNAMYLRKLMALQTGDWDAAERYRKHAELLAAKSPMRQMFTTMLPTELITHARAGDLPGVQHIAERIARLAPNSQTWVALHELSQACFHGLRGDLHRACTHAERCVTSTDPRIDPERGGLLAYCPGAAVYVETLIGLGRAEQARDWGQSALSDLLARGVDASAWDLERALAHAQGSLGDYPAAAERLERLIAQQQSVDARGVHIGLSYETRIRVAIMADDHPAITRFAPLVAREYRVGLGSPLATRFERLVEEAARAGIMDLASLANVT